MEQVNIGKDIVLDVDFDAIMAHESVVAAAVRFAVKQALTNTHAGVKSDDDPDGSKSRALAEKRLAAMVAGSWGQTERGSRTDAVTKVMRELAEKELKPKLAKIGKKLSDFKPAVWREIVGKHVEANEARFRSAAEAILAITPDEPEDDIDIAGLLGAVETE